MPRDHGKLSVTIFWFHENSWEPTSFLLMYMQKQFSGNMLFKLKLKNISVYSYLQCLLLKCEKKVNLKVTCVCTKLSKTQDSSLIQLKEWVYSLEILAISCLFLKRFGPVHQFHSEIVTKRRHSNNVFKLLESYILFLGTRNHNNCCC